MYKFYNIISLVYSAIVLIGMLVFPVTIDNDNSLTNSESKEKKECRWKIVLRNIILLLSAGSFMVIIIWLTFDKEYRWFSWIFIVFMLLERFNEAYMSMGIVKKTLKSSGQGFLSVKEQGSIMSIALFVGILNSFGISRKFLQMAEGIQNEVISDFCLLTILIFIVTIYYFLAGAMLLIPVKAIICLARFLGKRISLQWMTTIAERYNKWHQQIGKSEYVSIRFLTWGLKKKWRMILVVPTLIFAIVFDTLFKIIIAMLRIFVLIGEHILNGFIQIVKIVILFSRWIIGISDRKVVILSFRSALVFSLTSIVILNRYVPIIKRYEAGTAMLEFCSSAIVIPLVLSWIMDYRNKSNLSNQDEQTAVDE